MQSSDIPSPHSAHANCWQSTTCTVCPHDEYLAHELRYTLDAYEETAGIVIVTSHTAGHSLANLSPDVRSRLASGLMLQLAAPGKAARVRIVQHVAAALRRPLSDEAASQLADGVARHCQPAVRRAVSNCGHRRRARPADVERADRLLTDREPHVGPRCVKLSPSSPNTTDLPQKQLKSGSRKQSVGSAARPSSILARELTGASYDQIGRALGGRDHTTIMHNYKKIERERQRDLATQEALDDLRRILLSR